MMSIEEFFEAKQFAESQNDENIKNQETKYIEQESTNNQEFLLENNLNDDQNHLNVDDIKMLANEFDIFQFNLAPISQTVSSKEIKFLWQLLIDNRIRTKLVNQQYIFQNTYQKRLLHSLNRATFDEKIHFYNENDILFVLISFQVSTLFNQQNNQEKLRILNEFLTNEFAVISSNFSDLKKILNGDELLASCINKNEELKNKIEELKKCNLNQESQHQEQLNGKRNYFFRNIEVMNKTPKILYFQNQNDNNLYRSSYKLMQKTDSKIHVYEKLEKLSQLDQGDGAGKLLITYGIDYNTNQVFRFSEVAYNLEECLHQQQTLILQQRLEILITVIKALLLLHSQQLSHGQLSLKNILLDRKLQARLDIQHYLCDDSQNKNEFEKDIHDLGLLIEYLLLIEIIFLPRNDGIFVNCFSEFVTDIVEQCKIKENNKQSTLAGLLQWFDKFLQVLKIFDKINQSKQ